MSQFDEIEVFKNKNLADIFAEIYKNQETKRSQISELVQQLYPLIEGIGDATLLVPLIREYMELSLKNDDQLVKLAQIVQRVDAGRKSSSADSFFDFSSLQDLVEEDKHIEKKVEEIKEETKDTLKTRASA